jgi:hypothetical protein
MERKINFVQKKKEITENKLFFRRNKQKSILITKKNVGIQKKKNNLR